MAFIKTLKLPRPALQMTLEQLIIALPERAAYGTLNLTLQPGETWGLLGPNGCGKTTLLHTLAGLRAPRQGRVWLGDQPLACWPARARAQQLALVVQQTQDAFPASLLDTALTSRYPHLKPWQRETQEDEAKARAALACMALESLAERCITRLSGGERQRLALACLLTQEAPLWLLDEPTNHLDLHHQVSALKQVQAHTQAGGSAMMALHDLNLASRFCTHLLLLYPDGSACWGEKADLLVLPALEKLYQQPLTVIEVGGQRVFVPE